MSNLDEFESAFRSASREPFQYSPVDVERIVFVCDSDEVGYQRFEKRAQQVLHSFTRNTKPEWLPILGNEYSQVSELLSAVEKCQPSIICTYRNLHTPSSEHPYSLGTFVDVLTQVAAAPVILFPREIVDKAEGGNWDDANSILAITDHLSGEDRLVSYAAQLTEPGGKLFLAHIEDETTFERYIDTISKIPAIDTDVARKEILQQLLKEPLDFIESCQVLLAEQALPLSVEPIVTLGHNLSDYCQLIRDRDVDVVVMNTKDEDQLAMHGLAYPLAVELRETPLLLL